MIAIDANIAVKWYVPEEDTPRALILFQNPLQLIAPALIRMEVCAAITRRVRRNELTDGEAREYCQEWFDDLNDGAVRLISDDDLLQEAIDLSLKIRHTVQDALYLAVSERHRIPLITADKPFHERARPQHSNIHLLSRWQTH